MHKMWGDRPESDAVMPFTVPIDHWAEKDLQVRLKGFKEGSTLEEPQVRSFDDVVQCDLSTLYRPLGIGIMAQTRHF